MLIGVFRYAAYWILSMLLCVAAGVVLFLATLFLTYFALPDLDRRSALPIWIFAALWGIACGKIWGLVHARARRLDCGAVFDSLAIPVSLAVVVFATAPGGLAGMPDPLASLGKVLLFATLWLFVFWRDLWRAGRITKAYFR